MSRMRVGRLYVTVRGLYMTVGGLYVTVGGLYMTVGGLYMTVGGLYMTVGGLYVTVGGLYVAVGGVGGAHSPYSRIRALSVLREIPSRRLASLRLPPAFSRAAATSRRSYSSRASGKLEGAEV